MLTKIQPDCIKYESVKNTLIVKFAKPAIMHNYFDSITKFKMKNKETAVDAEMRRRQMPKPHSRWCGTCYRCELSISF